MRVLLSLFVILLSGCSSLHTTPEQTPRPTLSWVDHQHQVRQLQNWQLNGKIGIRTKEDSQSATFYWLQDQSTYQIDIRGPWGQGGASISGSEKQVIVEVSDGEKYQGARAEDILQEQLGWQLPISEIYWWIRGLPSPNSSAKYTLKNNQLHQLTQNGWTLNYLRYSNLSPATPKKIKLSHDSLTITLIINEWAPL